MATVENEEPDVILVGDEELNDEALEYVANILGDEESAVAVAGFDFETKVLAITDQRVLIAGEEDGVGVLMLNVGHDDISLMTRDGRTLVIETETGDENRFRFGDDLSVEKLVKISDQLRTIRVGHANDDDEELTESEGDRRSLFGRVLGGIGSAKQKVSRSVDVLTGVDIRRLDEFTDAATRAVVGVHQDVSELQGEVVRVQRQVDDMRASQKRQNERIERLEQIGRQTNLTPWIAGAAALALVLSIVAVVMSAF